MSTKKGKRLRITERDFLLANRKAAREEEILAHGKPITFRSHLQNSKKQYNRKQMKKAITQSDDGLFFFAMALTTVVSLRVMGPSYSRVSTTTSSSALLSSRKRISTPPLTLSRPTTLKRMEKNSWPQSGAWV